MSIALYGNQLFCEKCSSPDIQCGIIDRHDDRASTVIQCNRCKHIYTFSYSVIDEITKFKELDSKIKA